MSSSSDSSDEENLELLREATDFQFINDSMYKSDPKGSDKKTEIKSLPPSLRRNKDEDKQFNSFDITPEFRNHIAKHLTRILDKKLENCFQLNNNEAVTVKNKKSKTGIKLLSDSKRFVKSHSNKNVINNCNPVKYDIKKRKIKDYDCSDNDEEKIKSVAVNAEHILSQKDTETWTYKQKIFNYKKCKNGTLVSLDKE